MNRFRTRVLSLIFLLAVAGCASNPAVSDDTPTGRWSGDYGLGDRREPIQVDLRWEGSNLTGTVLSGFRSLPLTNVSFTKDTGAITMEFDAEGNGGRKVHYVVEGKVQGDTMAGTWTHDTQRGDFRVTKE